MGDFKNYNLNLEECCQRLVSICQEMGIEGHINQRNSSEFHLLFVDGGIIRILLTNKKGITLSEKAGKNQDLGLEICKSFNSIYASNKVSSGIASYNVLIERYSSLSTFEMELNTYCEGESLSIQSKNGLPDHYFKVWEVSEGDFDKVTVSLYNSRKLTVQGLTWKSWKLVCDWIEEKLDVPVKEVITRFASQGGFSESVESFTTNTLISSSEEQAVLRLGNAYNFLEDHDKKFIVSALCFLEAQVPMPDYSMGVMAAAKALEGYLKKVLVHNNSAVLPFVSRANFNFGSYFSPNPSTGDHELNSNYGISLTATKAYAINQIYLKLKEYRHMVMHSGPSLVIVIDDLDEAISRIDSIISVLNSTYSRII